MENRERQIIMIVSQQLILVMKIVCLEKIILNAELNYSLYYNLSVVFYCYRILHALITAGTKKLF
jgi:hypothetical protein